ncbi:MAG TPA: glycine--tRNA ligase subunit beta, partial [Methylophilaceae bacterium]|nr:glycine--tRNA ligase subunit beta [Methylophilaceae bacterium]
KPVSQKLMPAAVGLDKEGKPTPALLKKLASLGADESVISKLKRESDGKAEVLFFDSVIKGADLQEGLQIALNEAIAKLPIPKGMTYQLSDGWDTVNFVRPAHGLIALHGTEVIPVSLLGLNASNQTQGHRFEAARHPVVINSADSYESQMQDEGAVIASFEKRREEIRRQLAEAASGENLKPIEDEALLDEVTALVERPNVLVGQFEHEFLEVPQECLILTMKANQKYFPLLDGNGKLTNKFLIVSNINPSDASAVIGGNERVVRPRLADAKFFFDQDRKKTLESRVPGLAKVVYHNKLGTQGERTERVRAIARWVADQLGTDPVLADRAALLAKADLLTDMVGEFPELQGIMGGYYARHDGEHALVAQAIADQYVVRRDDMASATNLVAESLLIADRVETLVGIWAIGLKPTGDKDPFALRRHALGLIRSFELCGAAAGISGSTFKLNFPELLTTAAATFQQLQIPQATLSEIQDFVFDRYLNQLAPEFGNQTVASVIANNPPLHEVVKRVRAVIEFQKLPEAESLAAANKRVGNILKKATDGINFGGVVSDFLQEPAEIALFSALEKVGPQSEVAFERNDYVTSLHALAVLKSPIDEFFDNVMVNAEEPALRANRLALLSELHTAMNRVADLSKLAV